MVLYEQLHFFNVSTERPWDNILSNVGWRPNTSNFLGCWREILSTHRHRNLGLSENIFFFFFLFFFFFSFLFFKSKFGQNEPHGQIQVISWVVDVNVLGKTLNCIRRWGPGPRGQNEGTPNHCHLQAASGEGPVPDSPQTRVTVKEWSP